MDKMMGTLKVGSSKNPFSFIFRTAALQKPLTSFFLHLVLTGSVPKSQRHKPSPTDPSPTSADNFKVDEVIP